MQIKKILLADDDIDDRTIIKNFFDKKSDVWLFPFAENGTEIIDILNKIEDTDNLPDLIILDQNMPRMNGKQTLLQLKHTERYAHIPVIIYTSYKDHKLVTDCFALGAAMIESKPSSYYDYEDMLNNFLAIIR